MPGRHGRRRGGGRRQGRVMSFIQPCLMLMLHRGKAHGYNLLNGLGEFGFAVDQLDPSLVYRALRDMEDSGLVTSEWDDDSLGPQRRMYCITKQGESGLTEWVASLHRTRQEIETLIAAYEQVEQGSKGGDGS
jgi:PadR family transcriptional regulator PadR